MTIAEPNATAQSRRRLTPEEKIVKLERELAEARAAASVRILGKSKAGKKVMGALRALRYASTHPETANPDIAKVAGEIAESLTAKLAKVYGVKPDALMPPDETPDLPFDNE